MTAPTSTRVNVLAVGARLVEQAGRTVITLQRVRPDVWTVVVETGSRREDVLCGSYDNEVEAALIASGHLQMFRREQAETSEVVNHAAALAPGEIRTHTDGTREVKVFQTPAGGYLVQVRRGGVIDSSLCRHDPSEVRALNYYRTLVTGVPA